MSRRDTLRIHDTLRIREAPPSDPPVHVFVFRLSGRGVF